MTPAKLKEIREKLDLARAESFVLYKALAHGETDLEVMASDLLRRHHETLTECSDEMMAVLRVVRAETAA